MCFSTKDATLVGPARRVGVVCWIVVLFAVISVAHHCEALDFTWTGDANMAQEYDTNIFRTLLPHDAAWGQGVDGRFDVSAADDRWDSRLNARFANRWYVTDNNLDYFNQFFNWRNKYRTERSFWNLDAQYNMDATLTSESDSTLDVGYVFRRIPRTTRILSPSWAYSLADDTVLNLSYEYRDTTYDKGNIPTSVVDSVAHTGGLSLQHQWSQALSLNASASYSDYTLRGEAGSYFNFVSTQVGGVPFFLPAVFFTPPTDRSIKTTSLMAGFNWTATDTITLAFSGGAQYNQNDSPGYVASTLLIRGNTPGPAVPFSAISNDALTEIITANAKKRFEYSDISFDYSRSVSPNLNGNLVAYDRYSLSGNHRFNDRISSSLTLSYSEQSSPSQDSVSFLNREIFSARTALNWRWDESWMINTSYQFSQVSYPTGSDTADSHAIFLSLKYLFDQHKL